MFVVTYMIIRKRIGYIQKVRIFTSTHKNSNDTVVDDGEEREMEVAAAATRRLLSPERKKVETERFESLSIVAASRNSSKILICGGITEGTKTCGADKKVLVGFFVEASGCKE